ncbi:hypothetical protein V6N13_025224 [Hibiscus sabdariffa]
MCKLDHGFYDMCLCEGASELDHGLTIKASQCIVLCLHVSSVGMHHTIQGVNLLTDMKFVEASVQHASHIENPKLELSRA